MPVQTSWLVTHPRAIVLGECLGKRLISVPSTHLLHGLQKPASLNSPVIRPRYGCIRFCCSLGLFNVTLCW
eukprot:617160-Pleurochrysis_carterae.AAC.1